MPNFILFLPGTGMPDQFYAPLLAFLHEQGIVHQWRYRHGESIVEACKRLGGGADLFATLRREVCFGPSDVRGSRLGLHPDDAISTWYEGLADRETPKEFWHRTVVIGHSQGAGHALLLSMEKSLAGAIMIAGPADAAAGQPAPWTRGPFQTPPSRRLVLVHAQDAGCRAILAHSEACGLRIHERKQGMSIETGGLALLDTEPVPGLSAHGCLAGSQTWAEEGRRQNDYRSLLSRHFNQWQRSGRLV